MTNQIEIGAYIEMNTNGLPSRLVHIGGNRLQTYRQGRNILTNVLSDFRVHNDDADPSPKLMTEAMIAAFPARVAGVMAI